MNTVYLAAYKYNDNGVGLNNACGENITFILRDAYKAVFEFVIGKLQNGHYPDFVKYVWIPACNHGMEMVADIMLALSKRQQLNLIDKEILLIQKKFRGNIGEMFAELYFSTGSCKICDMTKYIPINAMHEDYTDAETVHLNTGLPLNIQVKNFNNGVLLNREVFDKATAMFAQRLYGPKAVIEKDKRDLYIETPHQIIFSVTDVKDNRIPEDYSGQVMFIGPNEINAAGFQGNPKTNTAPAIGLFEKIIHELTLLS